MTQLTLPMETSVLISTNDISRNVNDIVETILRPNSMNSIVRTIKNRIQRYAYRHDKNVFKRDFKLYECDDCSRMSAETTMYELQFKTNKK